MLFVARGESPEIFADDAPDHDAQREYEREQELYGAQLED